MGRGILGPSLRLHKSTENLHTRWVRETSGEWTIRSLSTKKNAKKGRSPIRLNKGIRETGGVGRERREISRSIWRLDIGKEGGGGAVISSTRVYALQNKGGWGKKT